MIRQLDRMGVWIGPIYTKVPYYSDTGWKRTQMTLTDEHIHENPPSDGYGDWKWDFSYWSVGILDDAESGNAAAPCRLCTSSEVFASTKREPFEHAATRMTRYFAKNNFVLAPLLGRRKQTAVGFMTANLGLQSNATKVAQAFQPCSNRSPRYFARCSRFCSI